jgi:hypothetical protein
MLPNHPGCVGQWAVAVPVPVAVVEVRAPVPAVMHVLDPSVLEE